VEDGCDRGEDMRWRRWGGGGRWCEEVHDESSTEYRVVILIDFVKKATA
jgi:hypothetical protein